MFINLTTLEKTTRQKIKQETGVSIGSNPSDEILEPLGYANLNLVPRPVGGVAMEGPPAFQEGKWYQTWSLRPYSEEERERELKQELGLALARVSRGYQAATEKLVEEYPESEVSTFVKQDSEARAWLEDNSAATPFIDSLLAERQKEQPEMDKPELVERIITKSTAYTSAMGRLTGRRQALQKRAERETLENVRKMGW